MPGRRMCLLQWPSQMFRRCYIAYLVLVFIMVPLAVQTCCYIKIITVLNRKREFGASARIVFKNSDEHERRKQNKRRLIRMLLTSLVVFQLCYLPRGTLMVALEFQPVEVIRSSQTIAYAELIFLVLYYCKHVVNPVILFLMSADFRKAFVAGVTECAGKPDHSLFSQRESIGPESLQETSV